jgi:5-methylcytosine-specific restriction enzyme subunit McrC
MEPTRPPRTLVLTERAGRECRLTPADVDFLLSGHRAHVEVVPTGRRRRYLLTPTGHVGTIIAPTCRLVILPKIPMVNLFYLLDPTGPVPAVEDHAAAVPGAEGFDFLAGRLARLLAERAAAGLHRAYTERAEQGPFLQGRLDLPEHLRHPGGRKDLFHCRYEDFTADVPCNQVPRATAELVLRSPLLGDGVRAALRRALQAFGTVSPVGLGPEQFAAAEPDRLTEAYRPLLELCRLLFDSLAPAEAAGPVPCPAFLIDMERVFERYCASTCARHAHENDKTGGRYDVAEQPLYRVGGLPMRPDLVVSKAGVAVLILDAKWKTKTPRDDLYQVLAYCAALGVRRGVLVYPGRSDGKRAYHFERTGITLTVRKLRVTGTRLQCQRSGQRLARSIFRAAAAGR